MNISLKTKLNKVMFILMYETSLELRKKALRCKMEQSDAKVKQLAHDMDKAKNKRYEYNQLCSYSNIILMIAAYGFVATAFLAVCAFLDIAGMLYCTAVMGTVSVSLLIVSISMRIYFITKNKNDLAYLSESHDEALRARARLRARCEPEIADLEKRIAKSRSAGKEHFDFLPEKYRSANAVVFMLGEVEEKGIETLEDAAAAYEEELCRRQAEGIVMTAEDDLEDMQELAGKMNEGPISSDSALMWLFGDTDEKN